MIGHDGSGDETNPSFNYNNIFNNKTDYSLKNTNESGSSSLNGENNYWGTTSDSEIQALIYDLNDDGSLAIVDYDPYLTTPDTAAPLSPPKNVVKQFEMKV